MLQTLFERSVPSSAETARFGKSHLFPRRSIGIFKEKKCFVRERKKERKESAMFQKYDKNKKKTNILSRFFNSQNLSSNFVKSIKARFLFNGIYQQKAITTFNILPSKLKRRGERVRERRGKKKRERGVFTTKSRKNNPEKRGSERRKGKREEKKRTAAYSSWPAVSIISNNRATSSTSTVLR